MGHFSYKWKKWVILAYCEGQNDVICQTLGESGQVIVSLKLSKNYLSQVYGHKFGKKMSLMGAIWSKIGRFW